MKKDNISEDPHSEEVISKGTNKKDNTGRHKIGVNI